jgi:hypothetical protein
MADDGHVLGAMAADLVTGARQAKNRELEADASELRVRAEPRLGEMIAEQKATVGLNRGLAGSKVTGSAAVPVRDTRPTLADAGIDKKLSSKAQKLSAMPTAKGREEVQRGIERHAIKTIAAEEAVERRQRSSAAQPRQERGAAHQTS